MRATAGLSPIPRKTIGYSQEFHHNLYTMSVIITGAAGNLGVAVTTHMLEQGLTVYATVAPQESETFISHPELTVSAVDLLDEGSAAQFVRLVAETANKPLDTAILLAGGFGMGAIEETTSDDLDRLYQLNFKTAFHIVSPLVQQWKNSGTGGTIVFIGARPALKPDDAQHMVAYALSKSLLFSLANSINAGYSEHGIRAAVVVPSIIDTTPNRKAMPEADFSSWVPAKEIARSISCLLSDTGQMWYAPVLEIYNRS